METGNDEGLAEATVGEVGCIMHSQFVVVNVYRVYIQATEAKSNIAVDHSIDSHVKETLPCVACFDQTACLVIVRVCRMSQTSGGHGRDAETYSDTCKDLSVHRLVPLNVIKRMLISACTMGYIGC